MLTGCTVHYNLSVPNLVQAALARNEGMMTSAGALSVATGKFTGRSPKDKYVVKETGHEQHIAWGYVNQAITEDQFDKIYDKVLDYLKGRELYVFDGFAGADDTYRLPIRIINEYAWHNLFAHQLFIRPSHEELLSHQPEFTVIAVPGVQAEPSVHGTRSETFVIVSFERRLVLIGGTEYAGEMKKSIFTVLNYLLPFRGVLPMHCSANVGGKGDVALFFGLSGTGKTTLSADSSRRLIGDDEHGWSDRGVFNFEGGCYAKCLDLAAEKEPQIWNAIQFGTVLENVVLHPATRLPDYTDKSLTENTRAAYPLEMIPNAVIPGVAGHPQVVIFLTADAFGVLPPISKLTREQAMYHFLSGYTSKLAGTERGVTEPEATFSTCFGAPFLPLQPAVYAEMLGTKIREHDVRVYLVNTGWTGGPYGTGSRMSLRHTRTMVEAAIDGTIETAAFSADPIFGVLVPDHVKGIPDDLLRPRNTWADKNAYDAKALQLAAEFAKNFERFTEVSDEIRSAAPKLG
ncbi:phosphoenolpyruvate carboxykinase (ATP) [Paenibacillus xerothermodurans]|uniref:Phosphoenolpyruvate carboxykinase (ATP) n=2 Tax=Paenibacillus xerothermodurans TaxID=1977292 RepID=A0A2W1N5S3_PAEXE|nr:phosphoenolpyruvate carboxykinase (ATP) [Paenibacillus xerothermodurans]PZE19727.1 phosphoenolpyruvate carboxykinase (ATP) [Paenibacillus xerothermodurans]